MEGLGINLNLIIQQVVVFIVFIYLFNKFLLGKILKMIEQRDNKITEGLSYAEKMQQEYKNLEEKTKEEIEKAKKEASKIVEETKTASVQIGNEMKNKAKLDAEAIIEQAKLQLNKDRNELNSSIKKDVAEILTNALDKLGLEATDENKKKSIEQAIEQL